MNALRFYNSSLTKRPIITKSITSFITFGAGDVMCQYFEKKYNMRQKYDWIRAFRQASFGFLVSPYMHFHFSVLIPYLFPHGKKINVLKSVLYDQTVGVVVFLSMFFTYMDLTTGKGLSRTYEELKRKLPPTIVDNWKVWPFVMALNFSIVPIPYRVLFANIVGMFWNAYMSYVQNVKH